MASGVPGETRKGSFWWSILRLLNTYKGISQAKAGSQELFSFAKNNIITVKAIVQMEQIRDLFNLPLSKETYEQYCEMDIYLQL
jgi:hypothetical protein